MPEVTGDVIVAVSNEVRCVQAPAVARGTQPVQVKTGEVIHAALQDARNLFAPFGSSL